MHRFLLRDKGFYKKLMALAIPIILQNLINASLGLTDTLMVGRLGENELAAVTIANAPFFVANLMMYGLCSGASVLISQYWGKRDTHTISRVVGVALMSGFVLITIFSGIMAAFPHQIVSFYTKDPALIQIAARYMRIVSIAYFLNVFSLIYVLAHRSMENASIGTYIFSTAMLINTFLNWVLIFGKFGFPALGVEGAAIATVISRFIELLITIVYAARNKHFRLNLRFALMPGRQIIRDFFRYGLPVLINETGWALGVSLYPAIYGNIGTAVVAASTVSSNTERVLSCIIFGIANSTAVIIGNALGAGETKKAEQMGNTLILLSLFCGLIITSGMIAFIPFIPLVFNLQASTVSITRNAILIFSLAMPFKCLNFTTIVGILRAGGDVKAGLVLDIAFLWLIGLPLAAFLGLVVHAPPVFVFFAAISDEFVKVFFSLWRYRTKKWICNITKVVDS